MDRRRVVLLVAVALCSLFLAPAGTNGGRFYTLNKDQADPKPSVNESYSIRQLIDRVSPLADDQSGVPVTYFAVYDTRSEGSDGYYGFIATMDVYGFSLSHDQLSLASFWMVNAGDGAISSLNNIQIGWEVSPFLYGDSRTHFFVIWTSDGFQKTGCYNMKCPGFKPEAGATIVPGDIIDPVSQPNGAKQNITLKVLKDSASGDWLVHYGLNNRDPALIGRFPRSLFTGGLADKAMHIRFGGAVTTRAASLAPMGSGYLPMNTVAASISDIQFIDRTGQAWPVKQDLPSSVTNGTAYAVDPMVDGRFFYGGPLRPVAT